MRRVGAALRHHVDVAAEGASQFGLAAGRDHLELVHRVHAVGNAAQTCGIVICRQPVHDEAIGEIALAADGQTGPGDRRRLGKQLRAGDIGRRDAGHEQREIQEVASVHRQVLHFGGRDGPCDLAPCRFEHAGVAGDGDARVQTRNRERQREIEGRPEGERQCARDILEPVEMNGDLIRSNSQIRKSEAASLIGDRTGLHVRGNLARGDLRASYDAALRIRDATADARVIDCFLRAGATRQRRRAARHDDGADDESQSHWGPPSDDNRRPGGRRRPSRGIARTTGRLRASDSRRRRFGAGGAEQGRRGESRDAIARCESVYANRRSRENANAAGKRHQGRIGADAGVAHLACSIVVTGVMHRTGLPGREALAALGEPRVR